MYQYELPRYLPTADELPCSDDTPVDNELQELIPSLLKSILRMLWEGRMDWFFGIDMGKPQDRTFRNPKRRRKPTLEIHKLINGEYQLQPANPLWMPEIGLGIGSERANYDDLTREWLYWYDENGKRYPTPYERIESADRLIEQERQRAERLAAQLRALGIEPEAEN